MFHSIHTDANLSETILCFHLTKEVKNRLVDVFLLWFSECFHVNFSILLETFVKVYESRYVTYLATSGSKRETTK